MPRPFVSPNINIKDYSTWSLIKDIASYSKPYRGRFILGTILRLISDIVALYSTYAFASLVTIFSQGNIPEQSQRIWTIVGLFIATQIIRAVTIYFSKILIFTIADKVSIDVAQKSINHMFALDIAWHEKENTGNKLQRISNAASGF